MGKTPARVEKAIDDFLAAQPDIRAVTTEQILVAAPKATARQANAIRASRISRLDAAAQASQPPPRVDHPPGINRPRGPPRRWCLKPPTTLRWLRWQGFGRK